MINRQYLEKNLICIKSHYGNIWEYYILPPKPIRHLSGNDNPRSRLPGKEMSCVRSLAMILALQLRMLPPGKRLTLSLPVSSSSREAGYY